MNYSFKLWTHKEIIREGIVYQVTYNPTSVSVRQGIKCFEKSIILNRKVDWRTHKTDKLQETINSEDNEISFLGIRMLFNILNFKERKINELIKTSI